MSEVEKWGRFPTSLNLADICTRVTARNVSDYENIWFKGANFFYDKEDIWPNLKKMFVRETEDCINFRYF